MVANTKYVISFLESNIVTRFGVLESLVFDNASYFYSINIIQYALEKGIKLKYSANYYPQGNGFPDSSNKNIINIPKKTVATLHKN